jgi:hypothetical protein
MFFSIKYPELCREILRIPSGIHSASVPCESVPRVILKLPVNFLLAAKTNKGFKIYAVPVDISGAASIGLMCAFFDDPDSPLVSWRLLDSGYETTDLLCAIMEQEVFVHLFDDNNRELLGYRAQLTVPLVAKNRLGHIGHHHITHDNFHAAHTQAMTWFGLRTEKDDTEAIQVQFIESLFPEDVALLDMRHDLYKFHGGKGYNFTSLDRPDPGPHQEIDIINLLQRVFRPDQIYHSPLRLHDNKEIADVIVITDVTCLIVQAKDFPNTEQSLKRALQRKRQASLKMLNKATDQLAGAVNYLDRTRPLKMLVDGKEVSVEIGSRRVLSLAVVRGLFIDMYADYSKVLFDYFKKINLPCIALDYEELHIYTTFCRNEEKFGYV